MSKGVDGLTLTTKLKVDAVDTRDPVIKEDEFFKKTGMSLLLVLQDRTMVWLVCASVTPTQLKEHMENRNLTLESALIPTCVVKLSKTKASSNEILGADLPV